MKTEQFVDMGDFRAEHIGSNFYKITAKTSDNSLTLTAGTDVTTQLRIPFPHRWVRASFLHTDATYVVMTNSQLNILLKRTQGQGLPLKFEEYLYFDERIVSGNVTKPFGETNEYEASIYQLTLLGWTAGELVVPVLIIQKMGSQND